MDEATTWFGKRGYAAVTVADVAAAAGISKPLVYGYFGSKEGLYRACLERAGTGLTEAVARTLDQSPGASTSLGVAVLRAIFGALEARPDDWNVIYDRSLPPDSAAFHDADHYRRIIAGQATAGITAAFAARLHDEPSDLSALTAVWMSTVTALVNWWLHHPDQTATQMVARCERLIAAVTDPQP